MFPLKDNIPTERFALVTYLLIAANVLAYFVWQKGGILHGPSDVNVVDYGWIPYELKHSGQQCIAQDGGIACRHPRGWLLQARCQARDRQEKNLPQSDISYRIVLLSARLDP